MSRTQVLELRDRLAASIFGQQDVIEHRLYALLPSGEDVNVGKRPGGAFDGQDPLIAALRLQWYLP